MAGSGRATLMVCGLSALSLNACGGPETSVLALEERQALGAAAPLREAGQAIEIPSRIRGGSGVEPFLVQSAQAALSADEGAFGYCEERHVASRSEDYESFEDPILDVFSRNGAERAWTTTIQVGGCAAPPPA